MKNSFPWRSQLALLALLCLSVSWQSCSKAPPVTNPETENQAASVNELRSRLSAMADTGLAGSALIGLKESIEKIEADPAKRDQLLKDLTDLEKTSDPGKIKTIARHMADTL